MKRLSLGGVYEYALLFVLFVIVIHAPLTVWLGTLLPAYAEGMKAWKEVILAVAGLVAIVLITRHKLWTLLLRNKVLLLCLVFIDLHLLTALVMFSDTTRVLAGLMIDLRFIVMFMLMYVLVTLRPHSLTRIIQVTIAGAAVVVGFGLLQIIVLPDNVLSFIGYSKTTIAPYITIDSNPDFVRINSTLRGPNPLGALMVIYIAIALAYLMKYKFTRLDRSRQALAAIAGSTAVMMASFSRSAYLALAAVVVTAIATGQKLSKKTVLRIGAAGLVLGASLLLVSSTDWFSNVILHEDPESTVMQKSNAGHIGSLADGARRFATQPFGAGVGSTGSASMYDDDMRNDVVIENYYFFVAHEAGWLGALGFIMILVLVHLALWQRRSSWLATGLFTSGIGLSLAAILLPVWADDTVAIIWWGLAAAAIAVPQGIIKGRHATATRQQKTARTS